MICCLLLGGCEQATRLIGSGYRMTIAAPPIEPPEQLLGAKSQPRVCKRPSTRRYSPRFIRRRRRARRSNAAVKSAPSSWSPSSERIKIGPLPGERWMMLRDRRLRAGRNPADPPLPGNGDDGVRPRIPAAGARARRGGELGRQDPMQAVRVRPAY
jgi:hypothetical protein